MALWIWLVAIYFGFNLWMTINLLREHEDWLICLLAFFFGVPIIVIYFFVNLAGGLEG